MGLREVREDEREGEKEKTPTSVNEWMTAIPQLH
jgi:hypothetical protein